ncbi:Protein GAMETE EXPRESSED 2 [Acorus calamus]|uniref:Protein GAMETE EXPRESSED 2 n=1 Tax=Acorus calamus TaxID=4465 RepID=A0AAV9CB86_ACOCL|nr:Protein GAMETE EXPRESSED 2 [Acorus calamus]
MDWLCPNYVLDTGHTQHETCPICVQNKELVSETCEIDSFSESYLVCDPTCYRRVPSPAAIGTPDGYCDGLNSVVNGSGLASSDAGQISYFSVYLEDMYHNPSPVEPDRLHVKIMRRDGAFSIRADVTPVGMSYGIIFRTGRRPVPRHVDVARSPGGIVPAILVKPKDDSGCYELWVFCGNIALNNGQPFPLEVSPGEYFPEAHSDTVSVWEDESVSFDVLGNDYFKGDLSSFIASSKGRSVGVREEPKAFSARMPNLLMLSYLASLSNGKSENFYGNDVVTISGTNKNGVRETYVPIFVEPVNDPPFSMSLIYNIGEEDQQKWSMDYVLECGVFNWRSRSSSLSRSDFQWGLFGCRGRSEDLI